MDKINLTVNVFVLSSKDDLDQTAIDIKILKAVKRHMDNGHMDSAMSRSFGIRRTGNPR